MPVARRGDLAAHCLNHNDRATFTRRIEDIGSLVTIAAFEPGRAPRGYTVLTAPAPFTRNGVLRWWERGRSRSALWPMTIR
ncbi:hypothetical protein ABC974_28595 [Sphingomonas oligophenolica]|uniref:Uncharacterized protein n=1 Tax=Sphingomonas oligophenolica TaxID=301154 RepID=A0ABU9YCS1_9SPHN